MLRVDYLTKIRGVQEIFSPERKKKGRPGVFFLDMEERIHLIYIWTEADDRHS